MKNKFKLYNQKRVHTASGQLSAATQVVPHLYNFTDLNVLRSNLDMIWDDRMMTLFQWLWCLDSKQCLEKGTSAYVPGRPN